MEFGKIVVAKKESELEDEFNEEMSFEKGIEKGIPFIGRGYETEGYRLPSVGDYEGKDVNPYFGDQDGGCLYGIEVACLYNEAVKFYDDELQERISEAKDVFKDITGIEGEVWVVGLQT